MILPVWLNVDAREAHNYSHIYLINLEYPPHLAYMTWPADFPMLLKVRLNEPKAQMTFG